MTGQWTLYAINKYFGDRHRESIDARIKRMRERTRVDLVDDVRQLEADLGRALLLVQALSEACIEKGLFSREELAVIAERVDLDDGAADGRLDPATLRPPTDERPPAASPEEHLRWLEEKA